MFTYLALLMRILLPFQIFRQYVNVMVKQSRKFVGGAVRNCRKKKYDLTTLQVYNWKFNEAAITFLAIFSIL